MRYTFNGMAMPLEVLVSPNLEDGDTPFPQEQRDAIRALKAGESTEVGFEGGSGWFTVTRTE